ncbi:MAG TPA: ATP-binding protein [Rhizomicrobium sp.]|nr:ATP-binding protein [Rhizomicrobium sp.]
MLSAAREKRNASDVPRGEAGAIFADRIELLYRLGRIHLFLPFSAFCVVAMLYTGREAVWVVAIPLLLQIAAAVATGELARAYARRGPYDDPQVWADRYTLASAASGAAWGVGAVIWHVPNSFPTEAFFALAFLGMTATEFMTRCAYRPAYVTHAALSLGPLALRLVLDGNIYASLSAVLVLFFGGILYADCDAMANLLDTSLRLRRHNADLVSRLSRENAEVEVARDHAEASVRAKSAFIANISHELRTPLNALLGMAQLLERSTLDRTQRSHVGVLLEAGEGLKTLLDDVITLSRDEGDAAGEAEKDCDAAQAARTVARVLQPRAWEKQLKLGVTTGSNLPRVAADSRRVRQVLLKLADNALKFTPRGSVELRVESLQHDDGSVHLKFTVTDTGYGIPGEHLENIFEPFAAGDTSYTRKLEGSGLGLAVAKRLVEQLGGEIGFDTEPGQGSTFWFSLPAARASVTALPEAAPVAAEAPPPWGLSVLAWCADEGARDALTNMLEPFGNRMVFAETLSEAAATAGREDFDVVIVDANDADSLAAAPGMRAPILAIVAGGARAPEAVHDRLSWPAGASALYAALRELLGRAADAGGLRGESNDQAVAAIDAPAFAALEKSLGPTTLIEILHAYIATAETLCIDLSQASNMQGWDDATRIAQDIAGAAGGLGLAALMASARAFAQKVRDGGNPGDLQSAARAIIDEHNRVRRALTNLYPELVA